MSASARAARRRMPHARDPLPYEPPAVPDAGRPLEFAWRVHTAQGLWGGNADVKASVLLALEGGVMYAAIAALSAGRLFDGREYRVVAAAGIIALLLAIAAGTIAIFPRLRRRDKDPEAQRQVIYFGDLRHWKAQQLSAYIGGLTADEQLGVLCQQITEISALNWVKHRWVQASLVLSLAGITIITASAALAL
jgi:hypothetical protein